MHLSVFVAVLGGMSNSILLVVICGLGFGWMIIHGYMFFLSLLLHKSVMPDIGFL